MEMRDIIRGVFRLSVVVAVLAFAYTAYEDFQASADKYRTDKEMVETYECAARNNVDGMSAEALKEISNDAGLIDLSKVGCTVYPFLAAPLEIRQAREGSMRRKWLSDSPTFDKQHAVTQSVFAFLAVNLLGLVFLSLRGVFRWIADGFKPKG